MLKRIAITLTFLSAVAGCESLDQLGGASGPQLSSTDNDYLKDAGESDLCEMQLGQVAVQNVPDDRVKQFAQQTVDDHIRLADELRLVAGGNAATLPSALDTTRQRRANDLIGLSPADFERAYIKDQTAALKDAVTATEYEISHGKGADVKAFAEKSLPILRQHLQAVKGLAAST